MNFFAEIYRDSLEKSTYSRPSKNVLCELAGNLQFCLLCQGALQGITSSTKGLFSSKGIAQSPTPIDTLELGNAVFNPFTKGVANNTSPRSLFLRIKKLQIPTGIIDEEVMQVHPLHVSKDILMLQILKEVFH